MLNHLLDRASNHLPTTFSHFFLDRHSGSVIDELHLSVDFLPFSQFLLLRGGSNPQRISTVSFELLKAKHKVPAEIDN